MGFFEGSKGSPTLYQPKTGRSSGSFQDLLWILRNLQAFANQKLEVFSGSFQDLLGILQGCPTIPDPCHSITQASPNLEAGSSGILSAGFILHVKHLQPRGVVTSTASRNSAAAFITRFNNVPIRKKKKL